MVFRSFLRTFAAEDIICESIRSLFVDMLTTTQCSGTVTNKTHTLSYSVTPTLGTAGTYELTLQGESVDLALRNPNWVERHRFYIALGFDSEIRPSFTVVDFEPMLRTTKRSATCARCAI